MYSGPDPRKEHYIEGLVTATIIKSYMRKTEKDTPGLHAKTRRALRNERSLESIPIQSNLPKI